MISSRVARATIERHGYTVRQGDYLNTPGERAGLWYICSPTSDTIDWPRRGYATLAAAAVLEIEANRG